MQSDSSPAAAIPLVYPVINLIEIGAGGGSIARMNELGLMKVGPDERRRRSRPRLLRPRRRSDPTVTDANTLLGYLSPDSFLGGSMALDVDAATVAIERLAERSSASTRSGRPGGSTTSSTRTWRRRCAATSPSAIAIPATTRCSRSEAPARSRGGRRAKGRNPGGDRSARCRRHVRARPPHSSDGGRSRPIVPVASLRGELGRRCARAGRARAPRRVP